MPMFRFSLGIESFEADENTIRPSISILPRSGSSTPAMHLRMVVFPQPLGPRTVTKLPLETSKEMSLIAMTLPKLFVKLRMRTAGGVVAVSSKPQVSVDEFPLLDNKLERVIVLQREVWKQIIFCKTSKSS